MDYVISMSVATQVLKEMVERLDGRAMPGLYAAVSVHVERERDRLRRYHHPFLDPAVGGWPSLDEVDHTAEWVIRQSSQGASALGGLAGLAGAASVPPETVATAIAIVRLAQRLAVVYGFDPETDRGQMALWQALSAGLEVDLPEAGPMGVRLRDLPTVLAPQVPKRASVAVTRAVIRRSARLVVGRLTRLVPLLSSGVAAVGGRRRMRHIGGRMAATLRNLADPAPADPRLIADAVEVVA